MTRDKRNLIYIRICQDSGFSLSATAAAQLSASVTGCHPLDVLTDLGWDNMQRIAKGDHPSVQNKNITAYI